MTVTVNMKEAPRLKQPILICGLPGSGYVGKLAVDHMISELKAEQAGELYSYSFPPQVVIKTDGTAEPMKNAIYSYKGDGSKPDLLIFTGDSQPIAPEANYEVADKVLEIAQQMGAQQLYTLAAYITGAFVEKPRVFGTATDINMVKMIEKNSVVIMSEGTITGMNGVLVGVGKIRGMRGVSLLGETSGYVIDPKASQAVLEVLSKILGIEIDMHNLEARSKEADAVIQTIEKMRGGPVEKRGKEEGPSKELEYIS